MHGHRAQAFVLALVLALGTVGTTLAGSADPASPDPAAASPTTAEASSAPAMVGDDHQPAPAGRRYGRWLRGLGLGEAAVAYLAGTRSTVTTIDVHTYQVHHAFPDGSTADLTYRLVQDTGMAPADWPTLTLDPEADTIQIRYAVAARTIPKGMRAQVLEGLPALDLTDPTPASADGQTAGFLPVQGLRVAQGESSIGVVVDSVAGEVKDTLLEKALDPSNVGGSTLPSKGLVAAKFVGAAAEHMQDQAMYKDAQDKLDQLEDCAKEPTNPLTEKAYRENPAERQRVVAAVQNARSETTADAIVTTVLTLTGPASSLANEVPGLGFIVGPAKDWAKHTLKGVLQERLRVAEQEVVPCKLNFKVSGSAPSKPGGITLSGTICDTERPFKVRTSGDLNGTISFTPHSPTFGRWTYNGRETVAGFGVSGDGDYKISVSEDRSSGTLRFGFVTRVFIPGYGGKSGGGPVTLQLSKIPPC